MRAYIIEPQLETFGVSDLRAGIALDLIVDVVFSCLRRGGDCFQYSVEWADPVATVGAPFREDVAIPHVYELSSDVDLRSWLRRAIDPNTPGKGDVRSIATCRTASFGYDSQVFLLLRTEDDPPISPDPELVRIEERRDILSDTDWFDGWARGT